MLVMSNELWVMSKTNPKPNTQNSILDYPKKFVTNFWGCQKSIIDF